jgi:glycosyltransferase involved in cell wall biosynthesis
MNAIPEISVIAPVFNEVQSLPEFYRRVRQVLDGLGVQWELLLVDDGSIDGSTDLIRQLAREDCAGAGINLCP